MQKINHSFWLIGFILLIASVFLFIGGPDYYSSRVLKHFWDIGHILYFALLTILLSRWTFVSRMSLTGQWIFILTVTLALGTSIELLQYGTSRAPNSGDILRDITGSLLVLSFAPLSTTLKPLKQRLHIQSSVTLLTLVLLWPFAKSLIDETISWFQFPLLSSFDTPFEIDRWSGNDLSIASITATPGNKLLKLSLKTTKYSGVTLKHFNDNWTSARTLNIRFFNPDTEPLKITCRINDARHNATEQRYEDRYNRSFTLIQGWNQIDIDLDEVKDSPADRKMDMSQISGLGFFTVSLPAPRILYIDKVQLIF